MQHGEEKQQEFEEETAREFIELLRVMARLRAPGGCAWDRKQDHQSLIPYLLQETYEVREALESENKRRICDELGDLMLQVVFHSQIAQETGDFDMAGVCRMIREKLIKRHPHVFGNKSAGTPAEVSKNWEAIKRKEKEDNQGVLDGVSSRQPALIEAFELQSRAAAVGFDWPDYEGALKKVEEEVKELKEVVTQQVNSEAVKEEVGDLIFAAINVARFFGFDGEAALRWTNEKFRRRFREIEMVLATRGKKIENTTLAEMDQIWENTKGGANA